MKLSNKILIGFFGFIFIYLTAVFAEVRLRGTPEVIDDSNSIAETVDLSGIAYLVLQDLDKNINVVGSDHPRLEVRSLTGGLMQRLKHNISGDTLTLSALKSEDIKSIKITVFVPEIGLKAITVNAAVAIVEGLEQEQLYITQHAGRLWMSASRIGKIHTEIYDKSFLSISDSELDTLSAQIDNSEVVISAPVGLLEGSMKSSSFLRMSSVDEIQFRKDESSTINLYP